MFYYGLTEIFNTSNEFIDAAFEEYDEIFVSTAFETLFEVAKSGRFTEAELKQIEIDIEFPSGFAWKSAQSPTLVLGYDDDEPTEADIEFAIWHEMGHARDWFDGKLTYKTHLKITDTDVNAEYHVMFGPFNSTVFNNEVRDTVSCVKEQQRLYANSPIEKSANVFARQNCTTEPDAWFSKISYKAGLL